MTGPGTTPPSVADVEPASLTAAVQAQQTITDDLLRRPGIVGTGIRRGPDGKLALAVYAVSSDEAARANLPSRVEGLPVVAVVTGRFYALNIFDTKTKERPAPMGFSVGHPSVTAGTIGTRVTKAGNVYILSCNHVLANVNNANIGDPILQPGPYDGGSYPADQIGTLADFEPIRFFGIDNTIDAAIALVNANDLVGATPMYAYGAPSGNVVQPAYTSVEKFGRTTGWTSGTVSELNVTANVCEDPPFCFQVARFVGQFGVTPGTFSGPGDSGSLIVMSYNHDAMGLLFAGSETLTLANPISTVLQRFGVTIDAFRVSISGPAWLRYTRSYTWTANAAGGAGTLTYTWYYSEDGVSWYGVGTGQSYTRYVHQTDPCFWLQAEAQNPQGISVWEQLWITVGMGCQ